MPYFSTLRLMVNALFPGSIDIVIIHDYEGRVRVGLCNIWRATAWSGLVQQCKVILSVAFFVNRALITLKWRFGDRLQSREMDKQANRQAWSIHFLNDTINQPQLRFFQRNKRNIKCENVPNIQSSKLYLTSQMNLWWKPSGMTHV